ncbi:MAG: methyltransferase [Trueperaceae bacterium]|nr:methyltransferase [Trueperaceae bacterium]
MTLQDVLDDHAALASTRWSVAGRDLELATKIGVRGAPGLDPALAALAEALGRGRAYLGSGPVLDATLSQGPLAAFARAEGIAARVLVSSAAARSAALASGTNEADVLDALPWDLAPASEGEVWWRPPGDRGTARLEAELRAWARAITPDGVVWGLWHKEEGGNRAERFASELFEHVEIVNRASGWRLVSLRGPRSDAAAPVAWHDWEGPDGAMRSLVGTYAGRRVDPGTAVLLDATALPTAPELSGARVLDLGCGTGLLARRALAQGAREVIALDDDLAAVRSTRAALEAASAEGRTDELAPSVTWSDLLAEAPRARDVDVVLMNPPFHVGRQVVGALSRAFVAAALTALRPGGRLLMVANRALPYERDLAAWATWRDVTPAGTKGFKVLDAQRH